MRILDLKPKTFEGFPKVKTFFVVGEFKFEISSEERVLAARQKLLFALNLKRNQLAFLDQIQSSRAFYFDQESRIDFLAKPDLSGDALYTNTSGIYLSVSSADCLPVLFYNKKSGIVGAFHTGWPGTKKQALKKIIQEIGDKTNSAFSEFLFYFGPAAQACCYEVSRHMEKENFVDFFREDLTKREGGIFLDFVKINLKQLEELGVAEKQIENSGICTIHNLEYPSHRREREKRKETMLSIIGLSN